MYTIKYEREGRRPRTLQYATRDSAMKSWDKFCDVAVGGDKLTLEHPKGSIISQYEPAREEDRGLA
jgi:hypothetical protein